MTTARNFFESAQPAPKAGKGKVHTSNVTVEGIEMFASIKVVEDALAAIKEVFEGDIKVFTHEFFVAKGVEIKTRPENFTGMEGEANASLQLRKRSSASKLNEMEIALCAEHEIPVETVPNSFFINPKHAENVKLMARINEALAKVKDVPDDLFVVEEGKAIATEESLAAVFQKGREQLSLLLPIVSTLAIRAKLKNNTPDFIQRAFDRVAAALGSDLKAAPEQKATARAEKLPKFARAKKKDKFYAGE